MTLIPEMKMAEFKKLKEDGVKAMRSSILTDSDGNYLATVIVPQTDFIKMQAEYMGELSNGVKPKTE